MINLPEARECIALVGAVSGNRIGVYAEHKNHAVQVVESEINTPEQYARFLARCIQEARDIGFRQGQAHMRRALGLES